jgi:cytochrome c
VPAHHAPHSRRATSTRAQFPLALLLLCVLLAETSRADERGRAAFEPCRACHALDPAARGLAGPNLAGLIGRRIGGDPDFDYSPALRKAAESNEVWTGEKLDMFLADPEAMFPGLWMATRGLSNPAERQALTRFLSDPRAR